MMFVSGVFMVAAAVWTIMYNADLLLGALTAATGRDSGYCAPCWLPPSPIRSATRSAPASR